VQERKGNVENLSNTELELGRALGPSTLGLVYTWRIFTDVMLNNNRTQYSRPAIFGSETPRAGTTPVVKFSDYMYILQ